MLLSLILALLFIANLAESSESLDPKYTVATTLLETESGSGTGFFLSHQVDNRKLLFLVTANHVIHDAVYGVTVTVNFIEKEGNGFIEYKRSKNRFLAREDKSPFLVLRDELYDLAIVFLGVIPDFKVGSISLDNIASRKDFKENYLRTGETVYVLGFPYGNKLILEGNNGPIVRRCSVANEANDTLNNAKFFWIDGAIWPGNSGGPVVSVNRESAPERGTTRKGPALVGIVSNYNRLPDLMNAKVFGITGSLGGVDKKLAPQPYVADESIDLAGIIPSFRIIDILIKEKILPEGFGI